MEFEKKKLLNETYQKFMETGLNNPESLDILDEIAASDLMGFGTTIDERIFSVSDLKALIVRQREQSQGLQVLWTRNPVLQKVLKDENSAVFVDDVILEITVNEETISMVLRYTCVLEYLADKWVVVHFHGSKPENVSTEEDTWGIGEWKKRNSELEKLVKERTAELEESLSDLKSTQAQLIQSEKLASLGQLTAGIAHEIKNPLNFVNNFSELGLEYVTEIREGLEKLDTNDITEEISDLLNNVEENLKMVHQHGTRADNIVKSMLMHSRGGTGKLEPTDLNALIREYVNLAFHGMRAGKEPINVKIEYDLDESIKHVDLNPEDFSRVILNLCKNAFDAMRTKTLNEQSYNPILKVSTKKAGDGFVSIAVEDNGPGIPEHIKDKLFQPFFTTKKGTDGTGLGLSISHDIIQKNNGNITISSEENVSTRFEINLPIESKN
jgi:signal transduction histidine kinase